MKSGNKIYNWRERNEIKDVSSYKHRSKKVVEILEDTKKYLIEEYDKMDKKCQKI